LVLVELVVVALDKFQMLVPHLELQIQAVVAVVLDTQILHLTLLILVQAVAVS
jgi:hypothetical protein